MQTKSQCREGLSVMCVDFRTSHLGNGKGKGKEVPLQAFDRPRVFQEVKAPRFRDNGTGWW